MIKPDEIDPMKPQYISLLNIEKWQQYHIGKTQEEVQRKVKTMNEKMQKIFNKMVFLC